VSALISETVNLHIDLTDSCNLRCVHCRVIQETQGHELTTAEVCQLITRVAALHRLRGISLGGGEPLLREDLPRILAHIKRHLPNTGVAITTNGWLLDRSTARQLAKKVGLVQVSIDGATAATHDGVRGVEGSFERVLSALESCVAEGVPTGARYTVMNRNVHEVIQCYELCNRLQVRRFGVRRVIPAGRALSDFERNSIGPRAYRELLEDLLRVAEEPWARARVYGGDPLMNVIGFRIAVERMLQDGYFVDRTPNLRELISDPKSRFRWFGGCAPGVAYFYVAANGDVHPCPNLRHRLGNVLTDDIADIGRSSELLEAIGKRRLNGKCGVCQFRFVCGGCRAAAEQAYGDVLGEDPMCPFSLDEVTNQETPPAAQGTPRAVGQADEDQPRREAT
jgi:radical SAM protein with 4Fe4S-binding SPASM domain